jgi:hypothetical protein
VGKDHLEETRQPAVGDLHTHIVSAQTNLAWTLSANWKRWC